MLYSEPIGTLRSTAGDMSIFTTITTLLTTTFIVSRLTVAADTE